MEAVPFQGMPPENSVKVTNAGGTSPLVLTCDHASNFLPQEFGGLGVAEAELAGHIAWDPGALAVARRLSERLDATLIETCISRLVIDCNRPLDAPDLILPVSENTAIPGNTDLSPEQRKARIAFAWQPFHDTIERVVEERLAADRQTWLVSVHSFTPVYNGVTRPWHIGVIHDEDTRLATPLIAALKALKDVVVGINQPYSPRDRVYFTLTRHARSRDLPCVMVEIRNDQVATVAGQQKWGDLLAGILSDMNEPNPRACVASP